MLRCSGQVSIVVPEARRRRRRLRPAAAVAQIAAITNASTGAARASAMRLTAVHCASPAPVIAEPSSCGRHGLRVEGRRPAGRAGSPGSCRRARSARRGRRRSAAPPGRRGGRALMWSQICAWAPTSTPRVGCEAISSDRVAAHLAADDELLLVAARERPGGGVDAGRADVVLLDDALGVAARAAAVDPAALDARRPGLVAEDAVLPQRGVQQQPVAVPVLGDVADAGLAAARASASSLMSSSPSMIAPWTPAHADRWSRPARSGRCPRRRRCRAPRRRGCRG